MAALLLAAALTAKPKVSGDQERLWYDAPAGRWLEALPLGNGQMAAMVFGGIADESIQLNESTFCTYSARERKDLLALINDSHERYRDISLFGLHGESLGAATSIAVLGEKPSVDFVVADCGFSEIASVLRGGLKSMHMPEFLTGFASRCAKIRFGYSYDEMKPVESLKDNRIPILFIHGANDRFILPEHSERMKAATNGYAEIHLIPGADHAMSVLTDPVGYQEIVREFLKKISGE